MKLNFSFHDDVEWLLNSNKTVFLLKKDTAPLIISFLFYAFKSLNRNAYLNSEIIALLSDFLFNVNQGKTMYSAAPRYYLEQWTKEGFLRQHYEAQNEEATFELTPSAENALKWISEINKSESVGTESRLLQIFEMLHELVIKTTEDKDKRLEELYKQKRELDAEIDKVQKGEIGVLSSTAIRERLSLLEETSGKLMSDFRQVEDNFRQLNLQAREDQIKKNQARGKFLDSVFKARDLILESDQGKSFRAFWEFLMNQQKQEEIDEMVSVISKLQEVQKQPVENLRKLKVNLVEAGDRVNRTTDLLIEQLRRFLDSASFIENRRIADIIHRIEDLALAVRTIPPAKSEFVEIDDKPGVNLPMEKKSFEPPQIAVINSETPEEGSAETDFTGLFKQLYVDPQELKKRIKLLLRDRERISLSEIVKEIPIEKGLTEIVTYFSLATLFEKENKAIVNLDQKEVLFYESGEITNKIELPQVIFLK